MADKKKKKATKADGPIKDKDNEKSGLTFGKALDKILKEGNKKKEQTIKK